MAKISRLGGATMEGEPRPTAEPAGATEAEPVQVEESDVPVAPAEPYDTWLLADLQDECQARGLTKTGNKPDLVQRLIDDDNQSGGPEDATDVDDEVQPAF